ncbi:MAG TPA: hypothetical protein PKH77_23220 [Anaerolineae bacterium]|nr:hypothetical protein [Anaerolineae bacterium]
MGQWCRYRLLILLLGAITALTAAQTTGYRLDWWTLDSGGGARRRTFRRHLWPRAT